jgi:hypothetical protein
MSFDPISAAFDVGHSIIKRIWPDPADQARELFKLTELKQAGDLEKLQAHVQLMTGQMAINAKEAEHKSIFVAGWRPAVGWTGAISLALAYIPKSLAITGMWIYQNLAVIQATEDMSKFQMLVFPDLGTGEILGLLASMLGIGAMRSYDKKQGTETNSIITNKK